MDDKNTPVDRAGVPIDVTTKASAVAPVQVQGDKYLTFDDLRATAHYFDVMAQRLYRNISAEDFDAVKLMVNMALDPRARR